MYVLYCAVLYVWHTQRKPLPRCCDRRLRLPMKKDWNRFSQAGEKGGAREQERQKMGAKLRTVGKESPKRSRRFSPTTTTTSTLHHDFEGKYCCRWRPLDLPSAPDSMLYVYSATDLNESYPPEPRMGEIGFVFFLSFCQWKQSSSRVFSVTLMARSWWGPWRPHGMA